jgi:hypothetical protein
MRRIASQVLRVGLPCLVLVGATVACGSSASTTSGATSSTTTTAASAGVRTFSGSGLLAVDATGRVWTFDSQTRVLVAHRPDGSDVATTVDPSGRAAEALSTDDGGVVVARIECSTTTASPSEACDGATLVTERFELAGDEITTAPWAPPAPVADPTAVSMISATGAPLAFESGTTVVSKARAVSWSPADRGRACWTEAGLLAVNDGDDDLSHPDLSEIDPDEALHLSLEQYQDDGSWRAVPRSETTYTQNESWSVNNRCGVSGPEIGPDAAPATQHWTGDRWASAPATTPIWWVQDAGLGIRLAPTEHAGIATGIDRSGKLTAQRRSDGTILASVDVPDEIARFWTSTDPAPATGTFALDGHHAVICDDQVPDANCSTWET